MEPLSAYLGWLRGLRRAEGTIYQHSYHLRRFARDTQHEPWPVTLEQLVAYLATRDDLGASARRTLRQVLRGFYAWGQVVGRWDENPARHMPSITPKRGVPRPAPEHSVKLGLRSPAERTRLMVLLAVRAGLRCVEICQVRTDDLVEDLVGYSLIVRGKGERMRMVPVPLEVVHAIQAQPGGYLFPGQIHGHLSAGRVSELISDALPPGVTAHQLRHRYGTRAYQLGGRDIAAVQQLLGHAYMTTTQIYVQVEDEAVRRAALAAAG
ncbi:tyrosine-type recombinase/integrase [Microbacterium allomyrinae]|uniref:Tyrosine-type recombinase/integrase n=1 Tax=Microbacterium allomyrinae TaxID=2830666 RepID=A0A9X1S3X3_9MICO|nr:tyrosine-type recombinase/integrase [Microbacterium allomyrinae]MCC2032443.1 tyrosine-type recombinase/integrase [Microbacterium allomyrinae]